MKKKLLACISGGETSGMMAYLLHKKYEDIYDITYSFQNTYREDDRTLDFLHNMEVHWGINIVYLEAVVNPIKGKGIAHKVVDYFSAKRDGSVFESHIKKYGIPSTKSPHCTRDLKSNCALHYMKSIGAENHIKAIGFRYDEPKRVNLLKASEQGQWYPLYEHKVTKSDVKAFWETQPFKLGLKEWEGNCKMCFKKSKRKLLTQLTENPSSCDWIIEMEHKYPLNVNNGEKVFFFRQGESVFDLIDLAKEPFKKWVEPIYNTSDDFDYDFDEQEDCSESCEPFKMTD